MSDTPVTQSELEALALYALYNYFQSKSDPLELPEVRTLVEQPVSDARVELALGALADSNYVHISFPMVSGMKTTYSLTELGYKHAEELQRRSQSDGSDQIETKSAPAADRIVGYDHNSSEFLEVLSQTEKLKGNLDRPNDVGNMSPRAIQVAANEVDELDRALRFDFLRPAHIWRMAQSTLKWIGEQAAGAVVGQIALGLLALIAAIFGISFI